MWDKLGIRSQLVMLIALLLTIFEIGTLSLTYWFDVKERQALAIEQTQTLGRTMNHDLIRALINPQAESLSDISFRLSGFESVYALILLDNNNAEVFQYRHPLDKESNLVTENVNADPYFSDDFLLLREPLVSDNHSFGSVIFKISLSSYKTRLREQLITLLLVFPIGLLIGLYIAWWISRTYTQPFTILADAMKASDVQHNKYQYVTTQAENEISDMYNGYNRMIHQIEETNEGLRKAINRKNESDTANQAKSAFLANMSHELRTPLNAIIGYSEMIKETASDSNQTQLAQDSKNINIAGQHLLSLINNVLDLSKIEAEKMDVYLEEIDVEKLLNELTSTISPLINEKNNHLILEIEENIGVITADITKLRQILINLTSNANKFTNNGDITIKVWKSKNNGTDGCYFSIQDTGIGMTPDQLVKIFEPFSQAENTTTKEFGGTGLGLTISKHFSEMLGGEITIKSEPDKGSQFTVFLPTR